MDRATFLVQYPEFAETDTSLIDAMLAAAASQIGQLYWDTYYDQGHGLLTAAKLALSPSGQTARLQSKAATSTYQAAFDALRLEITYGDRVF